MPKAVKNRRYAVTAGVLGAVAVATVLAMASAATAKVFYAREELHRLAFPDAETVEPMDLFLTPEQRGEIQSRAGARLDSDLLTVYVGKSAGSVVGYALLDTHLVRTLPETFLVVLTPEGSVASTHVVAFHEPLEYLPGRRWLDLLAERRLSDDLRVGRSIAGITGSTLSTRAVVGGVRRALAVYEVLLAGTS